MQVGCQPIERRTCMGLRGPGTCACRGMVAPVAACLQHGREAADVGPNPGHIGRQVVNIGAHAAVVVDHGLGGLVERAEPGQPGLLPGALQAGEQPWARWPGARRCSGGPRPRRLLEGGGIIVGG